MKKIRLQKGNSHRNPIFQKRGSSQLEHYQTKNDGRTISPRVQNTGKSVFQNMKAELSSIKQDFEKIIKKEVNLKPQTPLTLNNSNKPKYCTSDRKDPRPASNYQKYDFENVWRDQNEQMNGILQLQKNLPCHREPKPFNTHVNQSNKNDKQKVSAFDEIGIKEANKAQPCQKDERRQIQVKLVQNKVQTSQKQMQKYKELYQKGLQQSKILAKQKLSLIGHIADQNNQLSSKNDQIVRLQRQKQTLSQKIATLTLQNKKSSSKIDESIWLNQKNQLSQQIHELTFHNDELRTIHQHVLGQNEQLKITISNIEQYCDDMQRRCEAVEADYKRKIHFIENDLEEYKKRQDMFSQEIQRLAQMPVQQTYQIPNDDELTILKAQNQHLRRQVDLQKQLHASLSQKFQQKINDNNGVTDLVVNLQQKLSQLIEQNGKLKTKINYTQSNVQSLNEQNQSYIEQISLYQQRQKNQKRYRMLNPSQWEEMTEEIQELKEENKKLREQAQFRNFQKDMEGQKYESPVNEALLKLNHDQIKEIEALRQSVREEQLKNINISQQLEQLKAMNMRAGQGVNYQLQHIQKDLDKMIKLNKALKEMIFSVIVQKAGKRDDQQELQHIIRQFSSIQSKLMI